MGSIIGVLKGDTRSVGYSSYRFFASSGWYRVPLLLKKQAPAAFCFGASGLLIQKHTTRCLLFSSRMGDRRMFGLRMSCMRKYQHRSGNTQSVGTLSRSRSASCPTPIHVGSRGSGFRTVAVPYRSKYPIFEYSGFG